MEGIQLNIKKPYVFTLTVMMLLVFTFFSVAQSKVSINVTKDQYVLPVAELASTKTNPEIINMSNELVGIDVIPNRGRILSNFTLPDNQKSFLYQKFVPDPMVLPGGLHTVEFGGYYLSLPWNTRDRQPFDLDFKIQNSTDTLGEIFLSGKDMFQKTLTEIWVRMKEANPVVEIEIKITNTSKKSPKKLDFRDYSVFSMDESGESNHQILLPVEKIKLIESRNDWAATKQSLMDWPAYFSRWEMMNDYIVFQSASPLTANLCGVYYPELKSAMVKSWSPKEFFSGAEIWSWGKNYSNEPGAAPYVVYSNNSQFTLPPQVSKSFTVYFTVIKNLSEQDITPEVIQQKIVQLLPK